MSKLKKALEKAKEDRKFDQPLLSPEKKQHAEAIDSRSKKGSHLREEIQVAYKGTKVIEIDPARLEQNRIFSQIKNFEATDNINILRTQILNKLDEIKGNSIMVTSANPGEGKTFTSINLGISIAQELDRTALIVDCDLREPALNHRDFSSDFLGIKPNKGLSDFLLNQAELSDIMFNPGIPSLTIIPGGKPLSNSAELLGGPRMQNLVNEMKSRYGNSRIIIFDSPSILKISDPLSFSRFVDGILIIVEMGKTTSDEIKKMMNLLKDRVILGTVLNKADERH